MIFFYFDTHSIPILSLVYTNYILIKHSVWQQIILYHFPFSIYTEPHKYCKLNGGQHYLQFAASPASVRAHSTHRYLANVYIACFLHCYLFITPPHVLLRLMFEF